MNTDKSTFINDGPFFDKYPDAYPYVTHFERTDSSENIIESWERGKDGRMHDTTARDLARAELIKAEENLNKLMSKENNNG